MRKIGIKAVLPAALGLLLISCERKYWMTAKVCNNSLYVEVFRISLSGEVADYLTDSIHFRQYIGVSDPQENTYTYSCHGESILVSKYTLGRESGYTNHELLSRQIYSLQELKKAHRFD